MKCAPTTARETPAQSWLERHDAGDAAALAEMLAELRPRVWRLAREVLGDEHLAEDATQATLLAVREHLPAFDRSRSLLTWVLFIATRKAIDLGRARRRGRRHWLAFIRRRRPPTSEPVRTESAARQRELRQILDDLMNELAPQQRRAFVLRDLQELSMAETAEALGCSLGAAKANVAHARRRLRELLGTRHPEYLEDPTP